MPPTPIGKIPKLEVISDKQFEEIEKLAHQSDYEVRYWSRYLRRIKTQDTWIRSFLLCTTGSGAIASLAVWKSAPLAWQGLSILSTVIAAYHTVANTKSSLEKLAALHTGSIQARDDAKKLLRYIDKMDASVIATTFEDIRTKMSGLEVTAAEFPKIKRFQVECQREIFIENNWQLPAELKVGVPSALLQSADQRSNSDER